MAALDWIKKRISVRTYTDKDVDGLLRQTLLDHGHSLVGPFGNRVRFAWVPVSVRQADAVRTLSTYGMIRGASLYLAGAIDQAPGALEDFGFVFESVLLKATELGLGTCWLGGTFDRSFIADRLDLKGGELIPAVTPVGFSSGTRHWQEQLVTGFIGVRHRKPLTDLVVGDDGLAVKPVDFGDLAEAFEAVRLGPSASNKQPWRMVLGRDRQRVHFYLEETPGYNMAFRARNGFMIQTVDLGIAYCHWEAVLADAGIRGTWGRDDLAFPVSPKWSYLATWTRSAT